MPTRLSQLPSTLTGLGSAGALLACACLALTWPGPDGPPTPAAAWAIGLAAITFAAWLAPRQSGRILAGTVLLGIFAILAWNVTRFRDINEAEPYRITRHEFDDGLLELAQASPSTGERDQFMGAYWLGRNMPGSTLAMPTPTSPVFRAVSRIRAREESYDPTLTAAQATALEQLLPREVRVSTGVWWIVDPRPGGAYRLRTHGTQTFIVPESLPIP